MEPRTGWLSDSDFVADGKPISQPPSDRQVCVRLDNAQYRDLSAAAELYGVAPSTMARMLVRRGTRAVLDSQRRDDVLHGGAD